MPCATRRLRRHLADEQATRRLGRAIAATLRPGDCLALEGDLGAGKTALARSIIQAAMGEACPVPSPTFTLVQCYDSPDMRIWHFDLYRLGDPDELLELGWDEAASDACLIEWPQRAGPYLPVDAVTLSLGFGTSDDERDVALAAPGQWIERFEEAERAL